jgi:hypothetical protein
MKDHNLSVIALAVGLLFCHAAIAEPMSNEQFKAAEKIISSDYKAGMTKCDSFSGNAEDICIAEAKGKKNVAKANLEDSYKPTIKSHYDARVAKAEADYSVSNEKCDDKSGNDEDVCEKEAKAAKVHEIADAKFQMKTSMANLMAKMKATDATLDAREKAGDAKAEATADKSKADYAVAEEKCEKLAGAAKDACNAEAKVHFEK